MINVYVPENDTARVRLGVIAGIRGGFEKYHPGFRIRMAKILVKEHKEEENIIIRTHDALFLEALEVYAKYYDVPITFYLWKDLGDKEKIEKNSLRIIYRNLGDPYDILDEISGELLAKEMR